MAPILIDSRDLLKFGLISILTAVSVFSAGFLFGHQQAAAFYLAGSDIQSLSLPEKVADIESDIEPQMPDTIHAGEDVDVDQPELTVNEAVLSLAASKSSSTKSNTEIYDMAVLTDSKSADDKPLVTNQSINDEHKNSQKESIETTRNKIAEENVAESIVSADADKDINQEEYLAVVPSSFTSDELNKIKYSIQVGMYGRLENAENMVEALQAQRLNAYVSDYKNKKGEVRYNVRFGYFIDKKAALSALKKYKNNQNGDGYLVRFSVENITNLARAASTVQPAAAEEVGNESLAPEIKQPDIIHHQEAPAEAVNTTSVILESPAETLAETQTGSLAN